MSETDTMHQHSNHRLAETFLHQMHQDSGPDIHAIAFPQTCPNSIPYVSKVVDEQPVPLVPIPHRRLGRSVLNVVPGGHW